MPSASANPARRSPASTRSTSQQVHGIHAIAERIRGWLLEKTNQPDHTNVRDASSAPGQSMRSRRASAAIPPAPSSMCSTPEISMPSGTDTNR